MDSEQSAVTSKAREELAAFLQAARQRLTPHEVGLPPGERRRVRGLRREEVAALAGIGITWYTWLEQGRAIQVSDVTLSALANALRLSEAERTYLFLLAAPDPAQLPLPIKPPTHGPEPPSLQALLDALNPHPALLRDQHWDILAWNQAEAQLTPWGEMEPGTRNLLLYLCSHPHARQHLPQWEEYTRAVVEVFRLTWNQFPQDERLTALLDHLQQTSSDFQQWWHEHRITLHPPLELNWQSDVGRRLHYSILYLTLPLHPLRFVRVLFSSPTLLLLPQAPPDGGSESGDEQHLC